MRLAKLSPPGTARAVARSRIFRLLDRPRDSAITWVSAPPGSGKTTAVASYLAAKRTPTLWYQVDADDADIGTFFHYLSQAAPARTRALPQFAADDRNAVESFARRFFRSLHERYKEASTLVLDNYQEAPSDCVLHKAVAIAAAELPKGSRIIVISRTEPPSDLARLVAHAAIQHISWEDLKFTLQEAQLLAKEGRGKRLAPKTVQALHATTDGWAAGLTLTLEQSRRDASALQDLGTHSRQVLFDYFATELFASVSAETRTLLLELSFLASVTASTAEQLTANATVGQMLERLHRQNLFTTKQGGREGAYQFHPLFREFLQARALQALPAVRVRDIRIAAASLLEAQGECEVAMTLLHDAQAVEAMIGLLIRWAPDLLRQWRAHIFFRWLDALPREVLNNIPWLLYWRGRFGTVQSYRQSLSDGERALELFRAAGDVTGMYLAWALTVFAHTYGLRGLENKRAIEQFDELQSIDRKFPSPEIEALVCLAVVIAGNVARRPLAETEYWADRAIELAAKTSDLSVLLHATPLCILQYIANGKVQKVAALVERMRELASNKNVDTYMVLAATMGVTWYEAFFALPSYRASTDRAFATAKAADLHSSTSYGALCAGAWVALTDGRGDLAAPWLDALDVDLKTWGTLENNLQVVRVEYRDGMAAWARWLRVLEALERGDARAAERLLPQIQGLHNTTWVYERATVLLLSAETYLALGNHDKALQFVHQAQGYAREANAPYVDFMTSLTAAHVLSVCGQSDASLPALRDGMRVGSECEFVNSHVWRPAVMAELCARALNENIEREYVLGLIERRHLRAPSIAHANAWPWPIRVYTLGRFTIVLDGKPLEFSGRVQRRPLELLQIIIALGARDVSCSVVIDALWPDAEADAAEDALAKALRRLRTILGEHAAVELQDNKLSIDTSIAWIDKIELEQALSKSIETVDVHSIGMLYKGDFLAKESDATWLLGVRERLRNRVLTTLLRKAKLLMQDKHFIPAIAVLERGVDIEPLAEEFYCNLMRCHLELAQSAEGLAVYRRCRNQLVTVLNVLPSPETEAVQHALRGG